jgi:NAD(P)-dependent dehydrogenase (short-subunit alcohol dehydrogenase family)
MSGRLAGKVAIVTGGNSGIGEAIVHRFAAEGARVVFCARREAEGQAVEKAVRAAGGDATFVACDVTQSSEVNALVARSISQHGALHIAIANAGSASGGQWPDESDADFDAILRLNLHGTYHLCRAAWPHLVAAGGGSIVAISSLSAIAGVGKHQLELMGGFQPSPSYQASKAAVEGLVLHLAGRGGEHDIRVNAVRPGRILTRQWEKRMGENFLFWPFYQKIQMLGRHGRSEDIASAALYLASDEAAFVTGEILDVDGGAIGKV